MSRNPDDVGTRYQHLTELRDVWEAAITVAKSVRLAPAGLATLEAMETSVFCLNRYIDGLTNYDKGAWQIRDYIENLERDPLKIEGGRGTPLKGDSVAQTKRQFGISGSNSNTQAN